MAQRIRDDSIPRFIDARRIPTRYQHMLPLHLMQQFQCAVLGAAPGVLTIAITDPNNRCLIYILRRLTNCDIFPVLVEPDRMRLLLQRLERNRRGKKDYPRLAFIAHLL